MENDKLASPSAKVVDIGKPKSLLKLHSFTFTNLLNWTSQTVSIVTMLLLPGYK